MEARFYENPYFEKELKSLPEVLQALHNAAEVIADGARGNVHNDSGAYSASVDVQEFGKGKPTGYRVTARTPYASLLEFGGKGYRAQYPLRNAVESAGLKFKKGR